MGISGYEALVMTTIAPFFLGIGPLRRLVANHSRPFHLLSLIGLLAYRIERPLPRLFAVGAGNFFTTLACAGTFFAERSSPIRLDKKIAGFSLGLILSSVAKFWNHTNNPLWAIVNEKS